MLAMTTLPEEVRIMAMSALVYVSLKTAKSAAMMAVKQRSRMATTAAVPKKSVLKNCLSCEACGVAWRACVHVYCHTNAHARGWGGAGCVALGDVCPRETLSPAHACLAATASSTTSYNSWTDNFPSPSLSMRWSRS